MGVNAAAETNRFFADWNPQATDANDEAAQDAATIAARSWDLWRNDPYYRALIETQVELCVGAEGLRFRSLYQEDSSPDTSPAEQSQRYEIDAVIRRATVRTRLDAAGLLTYPEMSEQVYRSCKITGSGYAIRVWKPGRPDAYQGTCWRTIDSSRVSNPGNGADTERLVMGHELDADGREVAIHVQRTHPHVLRTAPSSEWQRIPIWAEDGSRNVTHRRASSRPEAIRTVGSGAAVLLYLRMLSKTTEAWAIAKRIQASYALLIKTEDPDASARADRYGSVLGGRVPITPGMRYYHNHTEVEPLNWNFQGSDYENFRNPIIEAICAAEGVPYEMVLKRLTKSNMASSRAALLTAYQFARREQNRQIESGETYWIDSILREAVARGELNPRSSDWDEIRRGRWLRPPRVWPDPLKEAQAAEAWIKLGRSKTSAFDEAGMDHEQETMQKARDLQYENLQGVGENPSPDSVALRDANFVDRVVAAQAKIEEAKAEGLTWPAVITASAAVTAPGAYLDAMTGAATSPPSDAPPGAEPKQPDAEEREDETESDEDEDENAEAVLVADAHGRPQLISRCRETGCKNSGV